MTGRRRLAHRGRHGRHVHRPRRGLARMARSACARSAPPRRSRPRPSSQALERTDLDLAQSSSTTSSLGTTIATNAVLQRAGARTLFVTTAGFEDILYIQRIDRKGLYDLQWVKARPYALRHDTLGVRERILVRRVGADAADRRRGRAGRGRRRRAKLAESPDAAVAIELPLRVRQSASTSGASPTRCAPPIPACRCPSPARSRPIWREYERSSTTVMDAYVKPIVRAIRRRTRGRASAERRISGWHALMSSNGGQVPVRACRRPSQRDGALRAGGRHDRRQPLGARRRAATRPSPWTWAARPRTSASSSTGSCGSRACSRSSSACPSRCPSST